MKKIFIIAAITFGLSLPVTLLAQNPPHPNNGGAPTSTNTTVGGTAGAPVGNGTFILLALAMAYAGRKAYKNHTKEEAAE